MNGQVTVFGGGGFIGRYAVEALVRDGWRVRVAARHPKSAWFVRSQGALGQMGFAAADVTRPETVAAAVAGADAVVNLVGAMGGRVDAVNAEGAGTVARAAAAVGARAFVHMSAIGADAGSPSAYGRSKAAGEAAVRDAFPTATILRPSVVFGPEDDFVNRLARMARVLPVLPVLAGETRLQPVFAGDVGRAVALALADPKAFGGRTLALGGPDVLTMAALSDYAARTAGHKRTLFAVPEGMAALLARFGDWLPGMPVTSDQLAMLSRDNVVGADEDGFEALGLRPTPLAAVAPEWLTQYRRQGRFARQAA